MSVEPMTARASAQLRAAWDELLEHLGRARDAIDAPELFAPSSDPRALAEGYRYLAGFLYAGIERAFFADPVRPYFRRAIHPFDKSTIDNADALYLDASIDGTCAYLIRGRVADHRHWHGGQRPATGPVAPQYLIVEAHGSYPGDSGEIMELMNGSRFVTSSIDTVDLLVDRDGTFEILVGPDRPAGHDGNFLATRTASDDGDAQIAQHVILRVLYHDWEREQAPELEITCLNDAPPPVPLDPATSAAALVRAGELAANQMRFWNEFYDVILEAHGDRNGDGQTFLPRNDFNAPTVAAMATGGGQNTNVYAGGVFDLDPAEALIVEVRTPATPRFYGFHLSNVWGESLDYANRLTSLNGAQTAIDADGVMRYVVAHEDPGVANWLDTTGLREGFLTIRWSYSPQPPGELPTARAFVVPAAEVRDHLPAGTARTSPADRREQVRSRQRHVQRRYRQY